MTAVLQWGMHRNQRTALVTLIINTLRCVNRLNVTSSISRGWIQRLIQRITLQKHSPEHFFTGKQITYLDIFLQNTPLCMTIVNNVVHNNVWDDNIVQYVPTSFTTPATAKVNRMYMPTQDNINGNPWLTTVLRNEEYNSMYRL